MAFLDLEIGSPVALRAAAGTPLKLSRQERQVVLLSRGERLPSRVPGAPLIGRLFGIEAPHRLADPRLEALRRYALMYRLQPMRVAAEADQANAAGLSPMTLSLARDLIDRGRRTERSTPARRAIAFAGKFIAAGAAAAIMISGLEPLLNSRLLASILTGVAGVIVAPFLARAGAPADARKGGH